MDEYETEAKVLNAIKGYKIGETKEYNALASLLADPNIDHTVLTVYVKALKKVIHHIDQVHETLIGVILNVDWIILNQATVDLFIEFITELISARTYYLKVCIRNLIKQFAPKSDITTSEDLEKFQAKLENVHLTLKSVTSLAPLSCKCVTDNVAKYFPFIGKSLFIIETYIVNILQISTYVPASRLHILSLCIDKMMSIDVRIPRSLFEQHSEDEMDMQFGGDMEKERNLKENENIAKLDQLMIVLMTYVHSFCHKNSILDFHLGEILFKELLKVYTGVILKTQQSLHVQFVIFYAASFDQKFSDAFLDCCWQSIQDPNVACIIRQASAGYLSSFLARAKYIDINVIKYQLEKLNCWIHRYIDLQDGHTINADFDKHGPFYSACQASFYVFIYHHKQLVDSHRGFVKSLNFTRLITSRLNPLRFCMDTVVSMFARITRMYEIVFCYSVIERNNRNTLGELTLSANNVTVKSKHMEMFFPFDPYMLSRSKPFIESIYCEWNGSAASDNDSDFSGSDDEIDTSEDHTDACGAMFSELHLQKTSHAAHCYDMMCVSPGFTLSHHDL